MAKETYIFHGIALPFTTKDYISSYNYGGRISICQADISTGVECRKVYVAWRTATLSRLTFSHPPASYAAWNDSTSTPNNKSGEQCSANTRV